jgi:hypothetical protein
MHADCADGDLSTTEAAYAVTQFSVCGCGSSDLLFCHHPAIISLLIES